MSNMTETQLVTYKDNQGEVWTEVPNVRGRFLEDPNGERFTFVWVDDHFGPLDPS